MEWMLQVVLSYVQIAIVCAMITYSAPKPCNWVYINASTIPANTESLDFSGCTNIKPDGGALAHLYQIKKITIANTLMSEFPNITEVGSTLVDITMYNNNISVINPDYFIGLDKLQSVNLGTNPYLEHLPDVPQFSTVTDFYLQRSAYKELVKLSHASKVRKLAFDNNEGVTRVDKEDLRFYPELQILGLSGNQMQEFPDVSLVSETLTQIRVGSCKQMNSAPVLHMAALRTIRKLDISDTIRLEILPTLCHESLGSLTIQVGGSGLLLCDCRNAWLKQAAQARANIEGVDSSTTCGGLNWQDINTAQLLSVCTDGSYDNDERQKQAMYSSMPIDRPCAFPVHTIITSVALSDCLVTCAQTAGCLSVSFHDAGDGVCVIHAPPHDPLLSLPSHETGWLYVGRQGV